ncbi:enoyl-CoA hydratase-related protein [Paraferrimonas haliotis]|uniref:Gamma-carboxygeranoyl-CoA hydratase n=1 Tax=Paraferrimonas haliotis TaxID=2013866 RepID=A0AA37WY13_9GAMM|nr:enoyl-CoA hydratase-related protein [Paraferrimonas haliotis]GLS84978.1 gamma-carboxygeranoyl-CoA hydratase [Paraferrimonas haliotis]
MAYKDIEVCWRDDNLVELVLSKQATHNAFDANTISELLEALNDVQVQTCKALVLRAKGKCFSSGADLNWMRSQAAMSQSENLADSMQLAQLMKALDRFPRPTLALVQGPAYGGALGLIACCDVAIANSQAKFCLSEVKLGIVPAVISPYVVRAMGMRAARRYMLTAELFDAQMALELGLVHLIDDDLEQAAKPFINAFINNGPQAMHTTKLLLQDVETKPLDDRLILRTAETIARARVSAEGQMGLNAFFERRQANWGELTSNKEC